MITIRKATIEDLDILIEFQQQLALESENTQLSHIDLRNGLTALFNDPAKGEYYIANDRHEIVGCHLITYEWSEWRNGMVWWMQSVYVKITHRKMGVFRTMYDNLISLINNDPNLIGLRLYVDKTNEKAMKTYEAIGMNGAHYTVFEKMKE